MGLFNKKTENQEEEKIKELRRQIADLEYEKKKLTTTLEDEKKALEMKWKFHEEELLHRAKLNEEKLRSEIENMKATLLVKHEQDVARIKHEAEKELIAEKERLNKDFYERMTDSLSELHSKGNHTTAFLKEMTLKMLDKAPLAQLERRAAHETTIE